MRRVSLWRTTAFRMAMTAGLAVLLTFAIVTTIAQQAILAGVQTLQDNRVMALYGLVERQTRNEGLAGMENSILALLQQEGTERAAILISGATGRALAGNIPAITLPDGWSEVPGAALGTRVGVYRFFTGPVGPLRLSVGLSNDPVTDVAGQTTSALIRAAIASVLLALAIGVFVARRVQRRQQAFEATIQRVGAGDLAARIPISAAHDDLDRLSDGINAALNRLQTLVESMQQVSNDIAHDLRTPLNRIGLRIAKAQQTLERGGNASADLEAAAAETTAMNNTFSAILRIAQIEAGARRQKFTALDLVRLTRDVAEVYQGVAEDAGFTLTATLPDHPVMVFGDHELLTQALVNLVENVLTHCPAGTAAHLSVTAGRTPVLEVADNGPGIPPEDRAKVTRRFYRVDKSRSTQGSGLGLSLVQSVMDLHGATLAFGDAGPGLRVSIAFPAGPFDAHA